MEISYQSPNFQILPVNIETHQFIIPIKQIKCPEDMEKKWKASQAYRSLMEFIIAISESIYGKKLKDLCFVSKVTNNIMNIFTTMDQWIDEIPPITQPQRFGNIAFRDWFLKIQNNIVDLLTDSLDEIYIPAISELSIYLLESFGNSTRIDYGTGHELSFVAFMFCLFKIGALSMPQDNTAAVTKIFFGYIDLVRKLQKTYNLEPAGSQGVWNLDDYQFVPFIWGSAQLIDNPVFKPKSYLDEDICNSYSGDYMFFDCIKFINKVKTGPFAEHSNQLWNISAVPNWRKVNSGLLKMYQAEVLSKFPIIQHFLFGSLLRINSNEK